MRIVLPAGAVLVFLALMTVVLGSWYTVDQGDRGVVLRNGAVTGTAEPGLGFKTPIVEDVVSISVRSQKQEYGVVEGQEGATFEAYSRDQQAANMRLSVVYRVPADRVEDVYSNYGSVENLVARLLDPTVYEETKTVFGQFNALTAIQERGRLNQEVMTAITSSMGDGPLIVESIQIEDISFDDSYEEAIRQRMTAEVQVQREQQNANREQVLAEIAVTQAQGRADSALAEAQAQAEAIRLRGEADADAIRARAAALGSNPLLVELTKAERWNGTLPTTVLPDSAVPFISSTPTP